MKKTMEDKLFDYTLKDYMTFRRIVNRKTSNGVTRITPALARNLHRIWMRMKMRVAEYNYEYACPKPVSAMIEHCGDLSYRYTTLILAGLK